MFRWRSDSYGTDILEEVAGLEFVGPNGSNRIVMLGLY
jgi:hypothetical protein